MVYPVAVALDQISKSQLKQEIVFNGCLAAMAQVALFGVDIIHSGGLALFLYGGNWPQADGTLLQVPSQVVLLTPSATNYLYATQAGALTKATSAPVGWPGPLAASARALYQLTVDANGVTGGTCYILNGGVGPAGPQGPQGVAGVELYLQRKRLWELVGESSLNSAPYGLDQTVNTTFSNALLATTSLEESIGVVVFVAVGAGGSSQSRETYNIWHRGANAGQGGFDLSWRVRIGPSTQPLQRSFFGLWDVTTGGTGLIGNIEPNTLLNCFGLGANSGDANMSIINNDGSGTATMTALGASFPARTNPTVYELRLQSAANGSAINYTVLNVGTGATASGAISSNIPAQNQFLGYIYWVNSGASAGNCAFSVAQFVANSRY